MLPKVLQCCYQKRCTLNYRKCCILNYRLQLEFDTYWSKAYGKKIKNNGHRLYEAINGVHHKDYMPDFLFATKVEPFFNSYFYAKLYSDKSLTEILYDKCGTAVVLPKTHLVNSSGVLYNQNREVISKEEARAILGSLSDVVIKPTIGGNSGKGVMVCKLDNGIDLKSGFVINTLLDDKEVNYIVQERMKQHESISMIYPNSVNTIRTITYILDGKIYCADLSLRIGSGGKSVDNIHAGGLVIGLSNEGQLLKYAYMLGYSDSSLRFEKHPDTGFIFENHIITGIPQVISNAKKLHGMTPHIGLISWDFMVTEDGSTCLIEANYWGQSAWFPQIVHGKPLFGENTSRILSLLINK